MDPHSHYHILLALLCFHSVATFHTNQQQTGIVVPIYSSYDATSHWAVASIGNPPIHLRLLIDTGSHVTIVPGNNCSRCTSYSSHLYYSSASSTAKVIPCLSSSCDDNSCNSKCRYPSSCQKGKCCDASNPSLCGFFLSYMDGATAEGSLWRDVLRLESMGSACPFVQTTFGIVTKQTGFWDSFVDGLMGWSYGAVRGFPTITSTWLEDWVDQPNNRFVQHLFRTIEGSYRYR
ncbi:hypothetical protein WA588_003592 [Blastocystis sp. NMH]